jgi:hypothetical protein
MENNPWEVDSIQAFWHLKCPECTFFTAEENYFENHAVANHPLSAVLFEKTKTIRNNEVNIKEEIVDNVDHFIVGDIKKEPSEIINDAENDPFDLSDSNPQYSIHQERENLTIPVNPSLLYTEESEPMEPKTEPNEQSELQIPFIPEKKYKMQNTACSHCNKKFLSPSSRKSHMVTCAIETEKRYQSKKNNKKRYRKPNSAERNSSQLDEDNSSNSCSNCDKTFHFLSRLKSHMVSCAKTKEHKPNTGPIQDQSNLAAARSAWNDSWASTLGQPPP